MSISSLAYCCYVADEQSSTVLLPSMTTRPASTTTLASSSSVCPPESTPRSVQLEECDAASEQWIEKFDIPHDSERIVKIGQHF